MGYDKKYLLSALSYAVIGMGLGIFMAATHNNGQVDTHTHVLLIGFVVSLIYGVIHKLWFGGQHTTLAKTQFISHQAGAAAMSLGLLLLYGEVIPRALAAPVLGIASFAVMAGAVLMLILAFKAAKTQVS